MLRTVPTIVTSSLLAACVQPAPEERVSDALPTARTMHIAVPGDAAIPQALGQIADSYRMTRALSLTLNGGTGFVLLLLEAIVKHPPTEVSGDTYTWGPFSGALDPAEWRLVVRESAEEFYDWRLEGRSKSGSAGTFTAVATG
jgi:hypothetical protein